MRGRLRGDLPLQSGVAWYHLVADTSGPLVSHHSGLLDPDDGLTAAQRQRQQLKNPPMDVDRCLDVLLKQGLTQTAKSLAAFRTVL